MHTIGERTAAVTITEFSDYECPYCAGLEPVLAELIESMPGQLYFEFANFPLYEIHPHALTAALAAESVAATAGESAFWKMHHQLMSHQARLSDPDLRRYADEAGGDPAMATGDNAQRFAETVRADYARGLQMGVAATPSLFINGDLYLGRLELPALRKAVNSHLNRQVLVPQHGPASGLADQPSQPLH